MSGPHPDPGEPAAVDPRAEAAHLAEALRSHLARRERAGVRRALAPARPAPRPEPRPEPRREAPPESRVRSAPPPPGVDPPPTRAPAEPRRAPARRPAAAPAAFGLGRGVTEGAAAAIRERAAGCTDLAALEREVAGCTACPLARSRKQTVFADGRARVSVMFVGEAPGADEDERGLPFVGRAGELLTDIITKGMRLAREDVYIANVLKCRPPGNRDPQPEEKALCTGWLDRQIELVDPKVIVPLGRHAAMHVLGVTAPMSRLRGRVHPLGGRQVVPTYHPAYLLRSPHEKRKCWEDIQLAMKLLGLPASGPGEAARDADSGPAR